MRLPGFLGWRRLMGRLLPVISFGMAVVHAALVDSGLLAMAFLPLRSVTRPLRVGSG